MENQDKTLPDEGIENFKQEIKRRIRTQKIILSAIPAALFTVMWLVIIIVNTASAAKRASDKFDIEVSDVGFESASYLAFNIEIKNNSSYDISYMDVRISFYDTATSECIGSIETYSSDTIRSQKSKGYSAHMRTAKLDESLYKALWNSAQSSGLSGIKAEAEPTKVSFTDGKDVSYPNRWFGGLYIVLLSLSVAVVAAWTAHVFVNTYCKKCRSVLAVKTVGRRVLSEKETSWNEERKVKDKHGQVLFTYDEKVSGIEAKCEYKRKCSCCGNITYRQGTERHK